MFRKAHPEHRKWMRALVIRKWDVTALEQRPVCRYRGTLHRAWRIGMSLEGPKLCPVCGASEIQRILRVRFVILEPVASSPEFFDVAYRCLRGHVFYPASFSKWGSE